MDDSEQDFVDLCPKLHRRVRPKQGESRPPKKAEHKPPSQPSDGDKRRRNIKKDGESKCAGTQPVSAGSEAEQHAASGGAAYGSGDAGSSGVSEAGRPRAKDKVLLKMQQFKRVSPQKMVHGDKSQAENHENHCDPSLVQRRDPPALASGLRSERQDSDEALARQLQQELDREAARVQTADLEDGGLFFCHICHRDVSHMSPEGRTQHVNRCLDDSEESAPAPPPPPPPPPTGVPDCPICGKRFKSQKSRSTHLKRCSSEMGVPPVVLLQALQRQAEETQNVPTSTALTETGGTKRKGPSKPGLAARKKPRKKTEPLDEDTMVALALSSSLLERQKESENVASHISMTPVLTWKTDTGKGRGKKRRGAVHRPPPLLLAQDAEAAVARLQERVAALLLRTRAPSPPTPTRSPSSVPGRSGGAPLWQKSTLLDGGLLDFYTPELKGFITPWPSVTADATSSAVVKPDSSVQPATGEGAPATGPRTSTLPSSSEATAASSSAPSTPGTGQLPVGSQAVRDLMELAAEGVSLTQWGQTGSGPDKEQSAGLIANLPLSGFVPDESEEPADLCASGFLPETTHARSDETRSRAPRTTTRQPGADAERSSHRSGALIRLSADLSSMVNNPQLSDLQLQVDTGEVYFAHSFMVYARCPLLAEMVHEGGFGVQEEGTPAAQRVLMGDVPGQAVVTLLQYLYTAHCSVPASLRPHVLELASRFDLQELQLLCKLCPEETATLEDEQEENVDNQTEQAFLDLLHSMWAQGDEDNEGAAAGTDGESDKERRSDEDGQADDLAAGNGEISEENVNEEELEEIYEFAATQRKREEENDGAAEEEEEEEDEGEVTEPKRSSFFSGKILQANPRLEPDPGLDRSYSRLFSDSWGVYVEGEPPPLNQSPHKPSSEPSKQTLLQSSASVVDALSPSPPPAPSNLPVPGQSPGPTGDLDLAQEGPLLKRESHGPCSVCLPSDSPPKKKKKKKEPELIVLSDSSDETEAVLSSRSPSPCSPHGEKNPRSFTRIKPPPALKPNEPTPEAQKSCSLEFSPPSDLSAAECSPEVSWLIPSTPLQHGRVTATTQTRSSMCRTQLFPKGDASPASPSASRPQTSISGPTGGETIPRRSSFDGSARPEGAICNGSEARETFAGPPSRSKRSLYSSFTPLHLHPHSSTPLHAELHPPPTPLSTSPLHFNPAEQMSTSQGAAGTSAESPEKTESTSFHLSPLSDPSDPPSSDIRRGDGEPECDDEDGPEAEVAGSSFCQSFMAADEPPIAFNDSWGLGGCVEANPGCFSLRLEDSGGGASQQERSPGGRGRAASSSSDRQPSPSNGSSTSASPSRPQPPGRAEAPPAPGPTGRPSPEISNSLLEKMWDSWEEEEEEEEEALPLSQRVNPAAQLKTPAPSHNGRRRTLMPITPMPHYSDLDTPELKTKLNRFGVRPLPKRQMILKLKEIHQYTHQLVSSDSEDEEAAGRAAPAKPPPPPRSSVAAGSGLLCGVQPVRFKEPRAPAGSSPLKHDGEEEAELLSASQGSNTSSTAASEESERSNPELCVSSDGDSDSDGGISSSQAATRLQDRLLAVRSFILSNSELYTQILHYQPLVLSQLQARLKAAGIRLGAAKLVDYLDSQCVTFTTAKPGHSAPGRRRGKGAGKGAGRKRGATAVL